jgi:hypothetical protein
VISWDPDMELSQLRIDYLDFLRINPFIATISADLYLKFAGKLETFLTDVPDAPLDIS